MGDFLPDLPAVAFLRPAGFFRAVADFRVAVFLVVVRFVVADFFLPADFFAGDFLADDFFAGDFFAGDFFAGDLAGAAFFVAGPFEVDFLVDFFVADVPDLDCLATCMLSTRFGYGRPALAARFFAVAFWAAVRCPLVLRRVFAGAFLSHGALEVLVAIDGSPNG